MPLLPAKRAWRTAEALLEEVRGRRRSAKTYDCSIDSLCLTAGRMQHCTRVQAHRLRAPLLQRAR
eukprot:5373944-Alexandrium_andersonii.AAC.1